MIASRKIGLIISGLLLIAPIATSAQTGNFTVTPTSGAVPLTVSFSGPVPALQNMYTLNFGDGSTAVTVNQWPVSHTYTSVGTYTATLHVQETTVPVAIATVTVTGGGSCLVITHNLGPDDTDAATGGDVTRLQRFLAQDPSIYPEGLMTGYFGPATERAVQRWQKAHGIVSSGSPETTGYGYVGPKTRAAMQQSCGMSSGTFKASPTSGAAPLNVLFSGKSLLEGTHTLYFGDAQKVTLNNLFCTQVGGGGNTCAFSFNHTYGSNGTYTATLTKHNPMADCNPAAPICGDVVGTVTITVTGSGGAGCEAAITHDLRRGDSDAEVGDDVTRLQNFLKNKTTVYPGGLVTGFFGRATEAAVRAFQKQRNVLQTGFVGPLTRAAIKAVCDGTTSNTPYKFSATPTSGAAPLAVAFVATNVESLETFKYAVDFGDGARADMTEVSDSSLHASHSYTAGGSFKARLLEVTELCGPGITQYGCVRELQVDSLMVTVTSGGGGGILSITPASGAAPLTVTASVDTPNLELGSFYQVQWGDGSANSSPIRRRTDSASHTYASAGTFTATLTLCSSQDGVTCYPGTTGVVETKTVTVTAAQSSQWISVSPTSGHAPLAVTATVSRICGGTSSNPPFAGCSAFTLNWGDGTIEYVAAEYPAYSLTKTRQHTYAAAGTYVITSTISEYGNTYTGTATVTVSAAPVALGKCTYRGQEYVEGSQISVATVGGQWPGGEVTLKCDNGVWLAGGVSRVPEFGINACDWWIGGITFSDATRTDMACSAKKYSTRGFYVHDMAVTPRHGTGPLTVSLYDVSRCADVAIGPRCLPYSVSWGDGTTSDYPSSGNMDDWTIPATHTYSTAGSYTLTLTIDHAPWAYPAQTDIHTDTANIRVDAQ